MTSRREALRRLGLAGAAAILPRQLWALRLSTALRINGERLNATLTKLSEFGRNPQGGGTRLGYSGADLQAREWTVSLLAEAVLRTHEHARRNIISRRTGAD